MPPTLLADLRVFLKKVTRKPLLRFTPPSRIRQQQEAMTMRETDQWMSEYYSAA